MTVRDELVAIQEADPGRLLRPPEVVAWAEKNQDSALYGSLEWDNEKAGHAYRLWQVRSLVKLHIIEDKGGPTFVSLSIDRIAGGGYRSLEDVREHRDLRQCLLDDALAEHSRFQRKYESLQELEGVWAAADEARAEVARKRAARPKAA